MAIPHSIFYVSEEKLTSSMGRAAGVLTAAARPRAPPPADADAAAAAAFLADAEVFDSSWLSPELMKSL